LFADSDHFDNIGDYALVYRPGRSAQLDRPLVRISGGAPKYAMAAAKDGVRGRVEVHFYIDETGAVRQPAISSAANPYLAEQAVEALRAWKFEPATSGGRPVLVVASQEFNFAGGR
jgi:TonB family protein